MVQISALDDLKVPFQGFNAKMVFDPTPVEVDRGQFERQDWSYSAYGHESLTEELPPNKQLHAANR